MSLRKVSSLNNSSSPLKKKNMNPLQTYGLEPTNSLDKVELPACNSQDDNYDGGKDSKTRPSPASAKLLGVLPNLPIPQLTQQLSSPFATQTSTNPSPTSPQQSTPAAALPQQHQQRLQTPDRLSNQLSSHVHNSSTNSLSATPIQKQAPLSPFSSPSSSLPPPFVIQVTAIASLGGVLFGYDMGVIATALPQLTSTFQLDDKQQELVVSILYLGGGLGAALGGTLCDKLGRKPAILWTDVVFMIGACILFTSANVHMVCVGRVTVGFAVAVSGIADVSYLHEIAPTQWRGAIVSVNEACISLGFLLAFVLGEALSPDNLNNDDNSNSSHSNPPRGWRYMFGFAGVLALIQFLGMWAMPESPIWLKDQGRVEESAMALRRINGRDLVPTSDESDTDGIKDSDDDNDEALEGGARQQIHLSPPRPSAEDLTLESKTSYESLSSSQELPVGRGTSNRDLHDCIPSTQFSGFSRLQHNLRMLPYKCLSSWDQLKGSLARYRRQIWIALFLSVTQQFCGQTNVLNYAPTILRAVVDQDNDGGDDDIDPVSGWATLSIGLVKFVVTVLVIWKIESIGRRTLLLVGMGTISFGLLLVAVAFSANSPYLRSKNNVDEHDVLVQSGSGFYFALPGVLLVVSGYSMSFGPLTWLLTSELFPTDIRGRALGTSTIVTYLCAAITTYSFLTAQSILGASAVFLVYMLITVVGMVFACMAIPDTGGKTLEEIETDLLAMPWWKHHNGNGRDEPLRWKRRSTATKGHGIDALTAPSRLLYSSPPSSNDGSPGRFVAEAELT